MPIKSYDDTKWQMFINKNFISHIMEGKLTKISYAGRVTIPKEARVKARLKENDQAILNWSVRDKKLLLELTPVDIEIKPRK